MTISATHRFPARGPGLEEQSWRAGDPTCPSAPVPCQLCEPATVPSAARHSRPPNTEMRENTQEGRKALQPRPGASSHAEDFQSHDCRLCELMVRTCPLGPSCAGLLGCASPSWARESRPGPPVSQIMCDCFRTGPARRSVPGQTTLTARTVMAPRGGQGPSIARWVLVLPGAMGVLSCTQARSRGSSPSYVKPRGGWVFMTAFPPTNAETRTCLYVSSQGSGVTPTPVGPPPYLWDYNWSKWSCQRYPNAHRRPLVTP